MSDESYVCRLTSEDGETSCFVSSLTLHRRMYHMFCPSVRGFFCPDCCAAKKRAGSHKKVRDSKFVSGIPLRDLTTDF